MSVILLTGGSGQLGLELLSTLVPVGTIVAPGRNEMDLADERSVRKKIREIRPRWIVNPAAYTAVDKAESEPELAYAINAKGVRAIGEEAHALGAGVIHYSTDYVFRGMGDTPYVETDATDPLNVYGASKLSGEKLLAETGAAHFIFRTSWVYGVHGKNFLLTILKAARERERLRVVDDQHGAPTWSRDLAKMTAHVIERLEASAAGRAPGETGSGWTGIYHAAAAGETTWYGFAAEAVRLERERNPGMNLAELDAITTAEYPTPATRPQNSRLNCEKLASTFGWRMMDWRESLPEVMKEL
jgi:dTDP-4-dehydrorhamnose reductase